MIQRIDIAGTIISDEDKDVYDFLGWKSTCPADVKSVLDMCQSGDQIRVYINSAGGNIVDASEIYTLIREAASSYDVKIYITGEAASAASVIACSAYSEMAPTASMMVHCVSAIGVSGNHNDMTKMADILQVEDRALCSAYTEKSGMSEEEALAMMEAETWLTAEQAKEKGLVDAIMFEDAGGQDQRMVAGPISTVLSDDQIAHARKLMKDEEDMAQRKKNATTLRLKTLQLINPE